MPRPPLCRRIGGYPDHWSFAPEDGEAEGTVILTLDEYEVIRRIDDQAMTQESCAREMGVSRTTVTAVYDSARRKLADALVRGKRLRIAGGCYTLCGAPPLADEWKMKGEHIMRIAVTYENGQVFQHFGHTPAFKLYEEDEGELIRAQVVPTGGSGHGALAGLLLQWGVDVLICGGIGPGAVNALAEAGIRLCAGVSGSADAAAAALAAGQLVFTSASNCDHHDHDHDHHCGHHDHEAGCGRHEGGQSCCH